MPSGFATTSHNCRESSSVPGDHTGPAAGVDARAGRDESVLALMPRMAQVWARKPLGPRRVRRTALDSAVLTTVARCATSSAPPAHCRL
jgi:hypothetical protein